MEKNHEYLTIRVYGIVQGVGFRPFIYRLAKEYHLKGTVRNTSGQVEIKAEGRREDLEGFLRDIRLKAPAAARIERIDYEPAALSGYTDFRIIESEPRPGEYQPLSPDLATCLACREEIFGPLNRRYRYPFTNCTNCGPRFTIIIDIPYDRARTTMAKFTMCPECEREYLDPTNRRFHAQPNACPVCGPSLELVDNAGRLIEGDAINKAASLLDRGKIVAIKGLGGFLLACDATNEGVVGLLRKRKKRPSKPLAVMVRNLDEALRLCHVSPEEKEILTSPASPIVLLKMKDCSGISSLVAPGLKYLGVMLPYTPLHHLLMDAVSAPLVMTSGNLSEEPIAADNLDAMQRLGPIADYFLWHNRDIYSRYDDSVTMCVQGEEVVNRRARGYAPVSIELPFFSRPVLGVGAEMKASFCLTRENHAFLSQYIGDLDNAMAFDHYQDTLGIYRRLFRVDPEVIACDMHPDYQSTLYARDLAIKIPAGRLVPVQHHHAHIAAVMAENGEEGPVIGVALDGTGYGTDGMVWGGEFLLTDFRSSKRLAHLEYMPLAGGDAATRKPYRIAAAYLYHLMGEEVTQLIPHFYSLIPQDEFSVLSRQIDRRINTPLTSSCGRLFDAVSALVGLRRTIDYEAQAAIDLEMVATGVAVNSGVNYPFDLRQEDGVYTIGLKRLFDAIIRDVRKDLSQEEIAACFHRSLAVMIAGMCKLLSEESGINKVALSGGVFQNRLLLGLVLQELKGCGLVTISHHSIPPNDSCIALGQAVVAHFISNEE